MNDKWGIEASDMISKTFKYAAIIIAIMFQHTDSAVNSLLPFSQAHLQSPAFSYESLNLQTLETPSRKRKPSQTFADIIPDSEIGST